jgi:Putative transposase
LVSAGGFNAASIRWIHDLHFSRDEYRHELMLAWRLALIAYLEAAVSAEALRSALNSNELLQILETERRRSWNIFISRKVPKSIVINHIGRYIRKPPIAQYRLTRLNEAEVQYLAKDTRKRCLTPVTYTNKELLALLIPHVADRYCNSMRYFGLLAPRSKRLLPVVFDLLNQEQQSKPHRLSYAAALKRTFGINPFIGRDGSLLQRVGRIEPTPIS